MERWCMTTDGVLVNLSHMEIIYRPYSYHNGEWCQVWARGMDGYNIRLADGFSDKRESDSFINKLGSYVDCNMVLKEVREEIKHG